MKDESRPAGENGFAQEAIEAAGLSVVVPVFNEEEALPEFHRRLTAALAGVSRPCEIIYVNDGSGDRTADTVRGLRDTDARVALLDLSRNFGKEVALSAGLDYARGAAVVIIDADLQDPPELIPELVRHWESGYDMVFAQRTEREGEGFLKTVTAHLFYRVISRISQVSIPCDTGDFRLLSRCAVNALRRFKEQHRFMKGLFAWIGFPQKAVPYRRAPRFAGRSKWNYWRLWNFALEGITSFTIAPLKAATYLGLFTAMMAFIFAVVIIYRTLVFGDPVRGYPSLMVAILFLGGVQLITLGIMGEYLGRMFDESKGRPLYIARSFEPPQTQMGEPSAQASLGRPPA